MSAFPRPTRRSFLRSALIGSAGTLLVPGLARSFSILSPRLAVDLDSMPTLEEVWDLQLQANAFGARLTGSPAEHQYLDMLEDGFLAAGATVARDRQHFTRWSAKGFSFDVIAGPSAGPIPVAAPFPYSGATSSAGIEGDLVYLGAGVQPSLTGDASDLFAAPRTAADLIAQVTTENAAAVRAALSAIPGGVRGRIVLFDAVAPPPFNQAVFAPLISYLHDPELTVNPADDYKRGWLAAVTVPPLRIFREAGAAGVVFSLDASPEAARGLYAPFGTVTFEDLPALYVDRETGKRLRRLAAGRPRVRLTLEADVLPNSPADHIYATLRGTRDETMLIHTHTDGPNAIEENGGVALLALARYFGSLPESARERTIVFVCVTGHFSGEVSSTDGFLDDHPEIVNSAAACLTLEHLGATEWVDDRRGYRPTGRTEIAAAFHSQTPILRPLIESLRATDLRRVAALRPAGVLMLGEGGFMHAAGIPTIAYLPGPYYLVSEEPDGGIDKIEPDRLYRETVFAADLLHRLDGTPAPVLSAGDSALLHLQSSRPASR